MSEEKKDGLPKSLEGVLGDVDITEELKCRLAMKKQPKDKDCECVSLSDAEIMTATQTAHDIRTGKLNANDLEPPIDIHPALVEAAVCSPSRGSEPTLDSRWHYLRSMRQKKLMGDIEEDLKLSKKVVESLVEKKVVEESQRQAALR